MVVVGGVDLGGRKAAISLFRDGHLVDVAHLEIPRSRRSQELRTLGHWSWTVLKECDYIFVEEALVGRGVRASLQVTQSVGAVLASLGDLRVDLVPVKTWKKELTGNGNASKEDVAKWLQTNYPSYASACGPNQDRIDATCIGLYGIRVHERSARLDEL